jgi:HEAT repeat protein
LADRNPNVRRNAAEALERIGPRAAAAVPSLTAVLEDRDIYVQRNARLALKAILGEPMQQAGLN